MRRRNFIGLVGGAAAWPVVANAQQSSLPVVGFISGSSLAERATLMVAFRKGLREAGFVEGKDVAVEARGADGQYEQFPSLLADLIHLGVGVIAAGDAPSALAAKKATSTIPIVFHSGADPIEIGLVTSFSRPGGNLTGINQVAGPLAGKQIELLHELAPKAKSMAILVNPSNANADRDAATAGDAARAIGLQFFVLRATTDSEFQAAFEALARENVGGLLINSDVFFTNQREQLIALAVRHEIPTISPWREFALSGGLASYGPSLSAGYYQIGVYAGRILKGTKPADLPVVQPTSFEFVINLKTAKALRLEIPLFLQQRADEVIE